jgi:hypothetical protein
MKPILLSAVVLAAGMGLIYQSPPSRLPQTVTEVYDRDVSAKESMLMSVAEAMPEDKYDFAPVNGEFKGVRTFGQMIRHVAIDNYVDGAALLQEKIPVDPGVHENGPDSIRAKTELVKLLRDSYVYLHRAMRTVNQKNLMQLINFQNANIPRLMIVNSAISHPMDHYGQLIEYLRMNGIDPQAKR